MAIPLEWLVGPVGALALALWIIDKLWKAHQASDDRERKRADEAETELRGIIADLRAALKRADLR